MCGVVAMLSQDETQFPHQSEAAQKLFKASSIRGLHSFGLFTTHGFKIKTHELSQHGKYFHDLFCGTGFIFHNRYSTSGDWREERNIQPIISEATAIAFNGVISGGTASEMSEAYGIEMETENDAEIFLKRKDLRMELLRARDVSFAGAWIENGEIYYARNSRRPLYFTIEFGAKWLASTEDIFKRAGFTSKPEPVSTNVILKL